MSRGSGSLLVLLFLAPGCLVSFNDYPLGDLEADGAKGGDTGPMVGDRAGSGGAGIFPGGGGASTDGGASVDSGGAPATLGTDNLIDDFEDGDQQLPEIAGRSGTWYAVNDGRGVQTPAMNTPVTPSSLMPVREGSTRGLHTFGGPFQTWGALVGTTLATSGAQRGAYDLSSFQGIRLWVRTGTMTSPASAKSVRLNLVTPATLPGGGCFECNDHFGAVVPLTAQWTQVEVKLSSLAQMGFGTPKLAKPDLTQVQALELIFARNLTFDLWVDDIELY